MNDHSKNLRSDDAKTAMNAAKALFSKPRHLDRQMVRKLASDRANHEWSRVASIYLLGMLADRQSTPIFTAILDDNTELPRCRDYAAEALGYIGDPKTLPLLERVCREAASPELQESCKFALEEIPARRAS